MFVLSVTLVLVQVVVVVVVTMASLSTSATSVELDLLLTCRQGHLDAVLEILDAHPYLNINAADSLGETALHITAEHGYTALMRELLQRGARVTVRTVCDFTPLHLAASCPCTGSKGHIEAVKLLLTVRKTKDDDDDDIIDATTQDGSTALHIACRYGMTDVARLLLQAGASPHVADVDEATPWTVAACAHDSPDLVQVFLEYAAAQEQDWSGYCAAAAAGDEDLFDPTDPLHWLEATDGYTPLHTALQEGHTAAVQWWLGGHDDDDNSKSSSQQGKKEPSWHAMRDKCRDAWMNCAADSDGGTPLQCAVAHAPQCIAALLRAGANPAVPDHHGWTAWHWAADEGVPAVWQLLTTSACSYASGQYATLGWTGVGTTDDGETCLHVAARAGHAVLVATMLDDLRRLDYINSCVRQQQQATAAAAAVGIAEQGQNDIKTESSHLPVLLLSHFLHLRSRRGQTALHAASLTASPTVLRLLCEAGADVRATDDDGLNAFQLTKLRGQWDSLYVLVQYHAVAGGFAAAPATTSTASVVTRVTSCTTTPTTSTPTRQRAVDCVQGRPSFDNKDYQNKKNEEKIDNEL